MSSFLYKTDLTSLCAFFSLIFDFIPSKLEDPRCASGMCAILEKNNVQTEALGIKYKDAWDILENMKISKNSEVLFNIYDEPEFANVNQNTSVEELKNITNKVKQRKQTNKSDYKVGDIIGIYWPGSELPADLAPSPDG